MTTSNMHDNVPHRISLVHYWLFAIRGAEHVIQNISKSVPLSHIYCLFGKTDTVKRLFGDIPATFSSFNGLPLLEKYYRSLLPLYPLAMRSIDIDSCDVLISSESGPAKAVQVSGDTKAVHICYCHTPMRYLWSHHEQYLNSLDFSKRTLFKLIAPSLRRWDKESAKNVHYFIANSKTVQERIKKYYGRNSVVIYPPVRYKIFFVSNIKENYYLILSALVSYKCIDLAIKAFNQLGYFLKIVGNGPEYAGLKKMSKSNSKIEFLGRIDDRLIPDIYSKAKALIFPGEEDFGIVPLEAQASGTPVIAFRKGGATETVIDKKTGLFFDSQTTDSLIETIRQFEKYGVEYDPWQIRKSVARFSEEVFQKTIRDFVYSKWREFEIGRL